MTTPDIVATYSAIFDRLKTGVAGTAVRAALGGGANSIIDVPALQRAFPPAPFIAFEGGAIDAISGDTYDLPITWWIVDSPLYGYRRLNALVPLILAANPHDWLTNVFLAVATSPKEQPDMALTMNVRPLSFTASVRR